MGIWPVVGRSVGSGARDGLAKWLDRFRYFAMGELYHRGLRDTGGGPGAYASLKMPDVERVARMALSG